MTQFSIFTISFFRHRNNFKIRTRWYFFFSSSFLLSLSCSNSARIFCGIYDWSKSCLTWSFANKGRLLTTVTGYSARYIERVEKRGGRNDTVVLNYRVYSLQRVFRYRSNISLLLNTSRGTLWEIHHRYDHDSAHRSHGEAETARYRLATTA